MSDKTRSILLSAAAGAIIGLAVYLGAGVLFAINSVVSWWWGVAIIVIIAFVFAWTEWVTGREE